MSVGDTHTIQALGAAGTSVTGLTWTSSNPNVVSLSTDDPPVLTALAAGHVTIIAGTAPNAASADVTVWVGALPLGTVIWSNPGDGSGVSWIVPAVPSTTGVADVFAIQNDGTVQAITSDGTTAWAANISQNQASYYWGPGYVLPDFQGGLVVVGNYDPDTGAASVWKLDGITGQPYPAYTAPGYGADGGGTILCPGAEGWVGGACAAVHPDGTIFAVQENVAVSYDPNLPITRTYSLIGIDPATGAQKFNVPGTSCIPDAECIAFGVMIAGDGYAYLGYEWSEFPNPELLYPFVRHLMVLRVDSSGDYQNIDVSDYTSGGLDFAPLFPYMITNADQGILLTWNNGGKGMATITGGSLSPVSSPLGSQFVPVLQAQDGSFVGITGQDCSVGYGGMVSFDAAGNVRWIVPNDCPQIATADGGVIGRSGITYDQNGNATGMISPYTQSWLGYAYQDGPVDQIVATPFYVAASFWPFLLANASGNGASVHLDWYPTLAHCTSTPGCIGPYEAIHNALYNLITRLSDPAVSALAQTTVFNKLRHDASGNPLTTASFIRYLKNKTPGLYDGLRSEYCYEALTTGSSLCNYPPVSWISTSVKTYLANNLGAGAVTGTPSNPLLAFFRPSSILYNSSGENLGNEGVIFHEALHGLTGIFDQQLLPDLGVYWLAPSCNVTTYVQKNVLSHSQGLDAATTACPCDPMVGACP